MRGARYVLKRAGFALLTAFVAVTLNFVLFRALPGTAVSDLSRVPNATAATQRALVHTFGLDKSKWDQYVIYLRELAQGDLGISYDNQQPVADNLTAALGNTVPMVGLATLLAIWLGLLTGVVSAWRRGTVLDHVSTSAAIVFFSFPVQWLGLMLLIVFAGNLPTGGMTDAFLINPSFLTHVGDVLTHMALPAMTLALGLYGVFTLIVRSAMLETLGEDYILTARAKGLSPWQVVRRHALPNAMLPTATLIALSLGQIVAGAILVETVFSWPGIGLAVYQAVLDRDYPTLQGAFLLLTVSVVACNFLADLLYLKLDPRISE
jgi:peptide/nickel transport system permease protein